MGRQFKQLVILQMKEKLQFKVCVLSWPQHMLKQKFTYREVKAESFTTFLNENEPNKGQVFFFTTGRRKKGKSLTKRAAKRQRSRDLNST